MGVLKEAIQAADHLRAIASQPASNCASLGDEAESLKAVLSIISTMHRTIDSDQGDKIQELRQVVIVARDQLLEAVKLAEQANSVSWLRYILSIDVLFRNPVQSMVHGLSKTITRLNVAQYNCIPANSQENATSAGDAPGDGPAVSTLFASSENPDMGSKVPNTSYHQEMMRFLEVQLDAARQFDSSRLRHEGLENEIEKGERLIERHKNLDIRTFYKTAEVRKGVGNICSNLKRMLCDFPDAPEIDDYVPDDIVTQDRVHLYLMLEFVFSKPQGDGRNPARRSAVQKWLPVWTNIKDDHEEWLEHLHVVDAEDIKFLDKFNSKGRSSDVFKAEVQGELRAVKRAKGDVEGSTDFRLFEEFAGFFREITVQAKLEEEFAVKVLATTRRGWVIMELADSDLGRFCMGSHVLSWSQKLGILKKAARALSHVHSKKIIHCDIKMSNYLIFGTDPSSCAVKIADFGFSVEDSLTRSKTIRAPGGTFHYMAPEAYRGQALTMSSDVYSFGVIMFAVVTGVRPFRMDPGELARSTEEFSVLSQKLNEREPCTVHNRDCPKEMLRIMQGCIRNDAAARPTMENVLHHLDILPQDWEYNEVESPGTLLLTVGSAVHEGLDKSPGANTQMEFTELVARIIDTAGQEGSRIKYNRCSLSFLLRQIHVVHQKVNTGDLTSEDGEERWGKGQLVKTLKNALRLLEQHTQPFDLQTFYSTQEAKYLVELICSELREVFRSSHISFKVAIDYIVPEEDVLSDQHHLDLQFRYLLGDLASCRLDSLSTSWPDIQMQDWKLVKERLLQQLSAVNVIEEEDLDVGDRIGHGGFGSVHVAEWKGSSVAVKRLKCKDSDTGLEERARFLSESAVHASMAHPNITPVLAVTNTGSMVMELAKTDLQQWCLSKVTPSLPQKLNALTQAAKGLAHLHSQDVIHRDVKSTNFLVFEGEDGHPVIRLSDFGTAAGQTDCWRATQTIRQQPGTELYFAAELYDGGRHSFKSDVYSFGMVMSEVVSSTKPFSGDNQYAVMTKKLKGAMPTLDYGSLPEWLAQLIARCLSRDPAVRPSMAEVLSELESHL
eukprot:evm.model.scf_549EXC.2 EVM.evm.TU.scf_549EXC.2   scf_549EXC:17008-23751(+)